MIISLVIIGFAALLALVVYLPYRRQINTWFREKKYRRQVYVFFAVVIAVIAVIATLVFVFSADKSGDDGVAERPAKERSPHDTFSPEIGAKIPALPLPDTEGQVFDLASQGDKYLVISFWNTACKYCAQQLPIFQELKAELGDEVEVYLVNINEPASIVKDYKYEEGIDFTVLVDEDAAVGQLFQVRGTPTNYIAKNGTICAQIPGAVDLVDMVGAMDECRLIMSGELNTNTE